MAVLDTGIDRLHPARAGRVPPGWDFVDGDPDLSEVGTPSANIAMALPAHARAKWPTLGAQREW